MTDDSALTGEVLPPGRTPEDVARDQADPRSYERALERQAQLAKMPPRRPRVGKPPVTMIFEAMGLIDENGVPAPREDGQ